MFTNNPGKLVPIEQTISGFKEILEGKYDHLPEVAFYMVGNIDEVRFGTGMPWVPCSKQCSHYNSYFSLVIFLLSSVISYAAD